MNWLNELTGLQRAFALIAVPATMIMIFQFIMSFFGLVQDGGADGLDSADDFGDGDMDADFDDGIPGDIADDQPDGIYEDHLSDDIDEHGDDAASKADSLRLFTLRGIIGFLSIGGWMGVVALDWGIPIPGAVLLALLAGWAALYFVAWSLRAVLRLQQSGNILLENAIGVTGEVYIPIPPLKSGVGKVNIIIQDRLTEVSAVTEAERTIKTGEKVTVINIEPEGVLLVEPMVLPQNNPPEGVIIKEQ
ncbi:MAG: hypothetical protein GX625_13215 [Clostridiaceae bacterium]|nr:hypothetical protein [Clostridiaceae bacterium]